MSTPSADGLDLHLELDRRRVRASITDSLRDAIRSGRLRPGAALPSTRSLARDIGVARNTVSAAYEQLAAEGWLTARHGSRTVVSDRTDHTDDALDTPGVVGTYPVPQRYDLRPGWPNLSAFPRREWLAATRRAVTDAPPDAFGYADPRGRVELRTALADYLARARGLHARADQIVTCLGTMHGLALVGQALRNTTGASVWATESHGLDVSRVHAASIGYSVLGIPVDDDGIVVSELADADIAHVSPANQFPFGVALSDQRRARLVKWSRTSGGLVVEDDYDGELRHDGSAIGALQPDAPDQIVYIGSASKTLAPGLRLGWLVVPPHLLDAVLEVKSLAVGHNSALDQLTLAEFIRSRRYDNHLRRCRLIYRRRRDELLAALAPLPGIDVSGTAAGLHALVRLPSHVAESDVIAAAGRRELALQGLQTYAAVRSSDDPPALVIGYSAPAESDYAETLHRLTSTLRECS